MHNKNALVQAMMDVEYYPPSELVKMNIDLTETQKFPIEKAATLDVASSYITIVQFIKLSHILINSCGLITFMPCLSNSLSLVMI